MIQTNLTPIPGKIIIDWVKDAENKTETGIILTESIKRNDVATVIATAPDSDFKVGDKVIFDKLAGQFVRDKFDQQVLILKETDIWGIVE